MQRIVRAFQHEAKCAMASSQHSLSNCDIVPSELTVELPLDYADDICDLIHGLSPCVNMPFGHNRMHEDLEFATANTVKVDLHLQSFNAFHTRQYDEQLEAMPGSFDDSMLDIDLCREARRIHHARSISAVESNESIISRYLQMQDLDSERTLAGAAEDTARGVMGLPMGFQARSKSDSRAECKSCGLDCLGACGGCRGYSTAVNANPLEDAPRALQSAHSRLMQAQATLLEASEEGKSPYNAGGVSEHYSTGACPSDSQPGCVVAPEPSPRGTRVESKHKRARSFLSSISSALHTPSESMPAAGRHTGRVGPAGASSSSSMRGGRRGGRGEMSVTPRAVGLRKHLLSCIGFDGQLLSPTCSAGSQSPRPAICTGTL